MASYEFLTTWLLRAPRTEVWDVLQDPIAWPAWWRGVESVVELDGGDGQRVGSRYRVRWRSLVPYAVEFEFEVDQIERPLLMTRPRDRRARGQRDLAALRAGGVTAVTYDWRVTTTKPWMNRVAPLARPVFEWNHDWVMARGGEGLSRRLGVELIARG